MIKLYRWVKWVIFLGWGLAVAFGLAGAAIAQDAPSMHKAASEKVFGQGGKKGLLQLRYMPLGNIFDQQEVREGGRLAAPDGHIDVSYDYAFGARFIYNHFYVAAQRALANLDKHPENTKVETLTAGAALVGYGNDGSNAYLILSGGLGVTYFSLPEYYAAESHGASSAVISYRSSSELDRYDLEGVAELGIEAGYVIGQSFTLGAGVNAQLIGHPGNTKGGVLEGYLSLGYRF